MRRRSFLSIAAACVAMPALSWTGPRQKLQRIRVPFMRTVEYEEREFVTLVDCEGGVDNVVASTTLRSSKVEQSEWDEHVFTAWSYEQPDGTYVVPDHVVRETVRSECDPRAGFVQRDGRVVYLGELDRLEGGFFL